MSEERDQWMDALLGGSAGNEEQRLGARSWLEPMTGEGTAEDFAGPVRRWRKLDEGKRLWPWRIAWYSVVALVSLATAVFLVEKVKQFRAAARLMSDSGTTDFPSAEVSDGWTLEEKLLVAKPSPANAKQLWEMEPENPAYYAEYAITYLDAHSSLPEDFLETGHRLDPENAWFPLMAAGVRAKGCVRKLRQSSADKKAGVPVEWEIVDEEAFAEVDRLFAAVEGKSRLTTYQNALDAERIRLMPQDDPLSRLALWGRLLFSSGGVIRAHELSEWMEVRARQIGKQGDVEAFVEFSGRAFLLLEQMAGNEDASVIGQLVCRMFVSRMVSALEDSARELGVLGDYPWLEAMRKEVDRDAAERKSGARDNREVERIVERHGSVLTRLSVPMVSKLPREPIPVTTEELEPGRRSEFGLILLGCAVAGWVVMALGMLLVFSYRFRASSMVRMASARVEALLLPVDRLWIAVGGVVVPFAAGIGVMCFTPLGGREISLQESARDFGLFEPVKDLGFFQPVADFGAMVLLWLMVPVLLAKWRLARRARVLGFSPWSPGGWLAVGAVAAFVGLYFVLPDGWARWGLAGVPAAWLLIGGARSLFGGDGGGLRRQVVGRAVMPAYAAALLCLALAAPIFHASHLYWFKREALLRPAVDEPAWTPYEYRVARQLQREHRALLELRVRG